MTFQPHGGSAEVVRLPNQLSAEAEFLSLMALRRSCEERLHSILEKMGAPLPCEPAAKFMCLVIAEVDELSRRAARGGVALSVGEEARMDSLKGFLAARLPRSGLVQTAPGVLLFKGGRNV